MARQLIIAKASAEDLSTIARIFGESDRTDLPHLAGVTHRSLFHLGDVYAHLVETAGAGAVERARHHPEFARVSRELEPVVAPYLATWRGPQDALATCFYQWNAVAP
ncbi:MAG: TcmI family type II polyketide cyclase [Tetrasphaera sp.]